MFWRRHLDGSDALLVSVMRIYRFGVEFKSRRELAEVFGARAFYPLKGQDDPLSEVEVAILLGANINKLQLSDKLKKLRDSHRLAKNAKS